MKVSSFSFQRSNARGEIRRAESLVIRTGNEGQASSCRRLYTLNPGLYALCLVLLTTGLCGIFAPSAMAVGTQAGTVIENTAVATYRDVNGNPLPPVSSVVRIIVAQVCGADVSPPTGSKSTLAGTSAHYPAAITNTGNGNDVFDLTAVSGNGYITNIYFDANGNGVLEDIERNAGSIKSSAQLPADGIYRVIVNVVIPAGTPDGTTDTTTLTAESRFGDCADSATYVTTVSGFVLTLSKAVDLRNVLPGNIITYTIAYSNAGTATARDLVITDPIPAETTYVAGSITLNGVVQTDAAGDDRGHFSGNSVTVNVGDVAPGISGIVTFKVKIKEGVLAGARFSNVATAKYKDEADVDQPTVIIPGPVVVVDKLCGILVERDQGKSGNPGDIVEYAFTVTNSGNAPNTFNFSAASIAGWTWEFYVDANGNGSIDGGDYKAGDTNADSRPDTGVLNPGETKRYIASVKVLPGTVDETVDTTTLTATGVEGGCSDFVVLTTTATAPVLNIVKSVSPSGEVKPGTVVTYTVFVENIGSGIAIDVVVTDSIPANTTYIANSVTFNNSAQTDVSDADSVIVTGGSVVVRVGRMGPNGRATIAFQVKIN